MGEADHISYMTPMRFAIAWGVLSVGFFIHAILVVTGYIQNDLLTAAVLWVALLCLGGLQLYGYLRYKWSENNE